MFNKLLANLPFNPSLIAQISFYGHRMRQEASIRRLGFGFVCLALIVQIFAVAAPPQASLAASNNDLVNGGFSSAAQAAADCSQNIAGYGTILANYGISCARVAAAPTVTIRSTDFNRQLFSMGRLPYGIAGETPASIAGIGTVYVRYLWGWDKGFTSTYKALNVTAPGGQTFFLLYSCGNLTSVGLPSPIQKPPKLALSKTTSPGGPVANSTVSPGTVMFYRMNFTNSGGPANNVTINDKMPANMTFNWIGGGANSSTFNHSTNTATWKLNSMPSGAADFVDVKFQVNNNVPNGTRICNLSTLSATGVSTITSNEVCITVKVKSPPPPKTPPPTKPCAASVSSEDTLACIETSKAAANLTQNIKDANGTTAHAGDVIQYTLYAKNSGKATVKKYVFQENISDVLDYATVQNLNGGALDNKLNVISWPALDIPAGKTASKTFTVKVKDPIPDTPVSTSDPSHFDHIMTNVYGNTISINLPKTVASVAQTLPNTGPGTSVIAAVAIVVIAGYFFARSRLLSKEAVIVRTEYAHNGGNS